MPHKAFCDVTRPLPSIAPWSSSNARVFSVAGRGQLGQPVRVCSCRPFIQKIAMRCIFTAFFALAHLFDRAASFCTSKPWPLSVYHCLFLGPLLMNTDQCLQRLLQKSCSFGDTLIESSSHHSLPLIKDLWILTFAQFLIIFDYKTFIHYRCRWSKCYVINILIVEMEIIITEITMAFVK